jgi:hypothetical protein
MACRRKNDFRKNRLLEPGDGNDPDPSRSEVDEENLLGAQSIRELEDAWEPGRAVESVASHSC